MRKSSRGNPFQYPPEAHKHRMFCTEAEFRNWCGKAGKNADKEIERLLKKRNEKYYENQTIARTQKFEIEKKKELEKLLDEAKYVAQKPPQNEKTWDEEEKIVKKINAKFKDMEKVNDEEGMKHITQTSIEMLERHLPNSETYSDYAYEFGDDSYNKMAKEELEYADDKKHKPQKLKLNGKECIGQIYSPTAGFPSDMGWDDEREFLYGKYIAYGGYFYKVKPTTEKDSYTVEKDKNGQAKKYTPMYMGDIVAQDFVDEIYESKDIVEEW